MAQNRAQNEKENKKEVKKQNRATLMGYFGHGEFPTSNDFEELIASTLNLVDDGFVRTPANGFEITQLQQDSKLITFSYRGPGKKGGNDGPLYYFQIDSDRDLRLVSKDSRHILLVPEERATGDKPDVPFRVGINVVDPKETLDVAGVIRSEGRIGVPHRQKGKPFTAVADGKWKCITPPLRGCHAYEVMAGVGGPPGDGRYALAHAVALNAYHPTGWLFNFLNLKRRIRVRHAYYRSRGEKIRLRWHGVGDGYYRLQIRTNGHCGDNHLIRYYLTSLWFDLAMEDSQPDGDDNESTASTTAEKGTPAATSAAAETPKPADVPATTEPIESSCRGDIEANEGNSGCHDRRG